VSIGKPEANTQYGMDIVQGSTVKRQVGDCFEPALSFANSAATSSGSFDTMNCETVGGIPLIFMVASGTFNMTPKVAQIQNSRSSA
jgi:hypothetical protein